MSTASLAKKDCEQWQALWEQYQESHPGAFGVEAFTDWCLENGHTHLPNVNPKMILHRRVKKALREIRIKDPDGAIVRGMLAARIPLVDTNGNMVFDVQWDHIHKMSADHALLSFDQRDGNIKKQRRSANRDLQSFLKFNPNAKGQEHAFQFAFTDEDHEPEVKPVQKINRPKKKR